MKNLFAMILVFITLTFCACNGGRDTQNRIATSMTSSALVGSLASGVAAPTSRIEIIKDKEKIEQYRGLETEFLYEIKKQYPSRDAIMQDIKELDSCYHTYCVQKNADDPRVESATRMRDRLNAKLYAMIEAEFPLTEAEIEQLKVNAVYYKLTSLWDNVQLAEEFGESISDSSVAAENLQYATEVYENALQVKKQYEAGEISADQALKDLNYDYEPHVDDLY